MKLRLNDRQTAFFSFNETVRHAHHAHYIVCFILIYTRFAPTSAWLAELGMSMLGALPVVAYTYPEGGGGAPIIR